jgi:hypothetical protein
MSSGIYVPFGTLPLDVKGDPLLNSIENLLYYLDVKSLIPTSKAVSIINCNCFNTWKL